MRCSWLHSISKWGDFTCAALLGYLDTDGLIWNKKWHVKNINTRKQNYEVKGHGAVHCLFGKAFPFLYMYIYASWFDTCVELLHGSLILGYICLFILLCLHNSPTKKVTDCAKAVFTTLQLGHEKLVLVCRLNLSSTNSFNSFILGCTDRALSIFTGIVETTLMEGVLAEKVNGGQIECPATWLTLASLEDGRFCAELFELALFGFCFCRVAGDETTILYGY